MMRSTPGVILWAVRRDTNTMVNSAVGMAQAAGILAVKTHDGDVRQENALYFFVGIDNCRFKRQVIPGDQLTLEVEMLRVARGIGKFRAVAKVDGEIAAEAELMCARREV